MVNAVERPAWFDEQVLGCASALKAFALSLCRNSSRAEDMVQDTIYRAMLKFEQFEQGTNIKAWLFTIMRNQWYDAARKRGREVSDPDGAFAATVAINEGQSWAYDLKVVRRRMRMLNTTQRRSLELVAFEQHSYEFAAEVLGIAPGTVKSQVSRARAFLETGDEIELVEPPPPATASEDIGFRIEQLYRDGMSVSEIKAQVGAISRSDVMRVLVERRVSTR